MKILGIDPGTTRLGYGFIEKTSTLRVLDYGVIEIIERDVSTKIFKLGDGLSALIDKLRPDLVGVEKLYFAKNQKTALQVSEARGVILYILSQRRIPFVEYRPGDIKQAVTNYSLADKKAVEIMVKKILKIQDFHGSDDASDALAIAITAAYNNKF